MKYLVIIEPTLTGYSAYLPDIAGCVAVGSTQADVQRNMREALLFHVEGMRAENLLVPAPNSTSAYVDVPL